MIKQLTFIILTVSSSITLAVPPQQILDSYLAAARLHQNNFTPSVQRGADFYKKHFNVSNHLPNCASCHADNPTTWGQHTVTGKPIKPLAFTANSARFTEPRKVEKWFQRNCLEVVGRECFSAEKADFILFLIQ